jgi:hypothetical protein
MEVLSVFDIALKASNNMQMQMNYPAEIKER